MLIEQRLCSLNQMHLTHLFFENLMMKVLLILIKLLLSLLLQNLE